LRKRDIDARRGGVLVRTALDSGKPLHLTGYEDTCMGDTEAADDIRALFAAYGAGFDDSDPDAVTALFAYPATIWQFGEGHVFEDEDDLAENVEALMGVFEDAGIVLTTPALRDLRIAGTTAFATVAWRQEDEAGESLHDFTCHYLLLRGESGWRVATVVNEDHR
jgi:ketosteroid isomerase-like protein